MITTRTKDWPVPPEKVEDVPSYLRRLRQALVENTSESYQDLKDLVIEDSTEPPSPYPGQLWISTANTYDGYCKVRLDATEPTDTAPGMLWLSTAGGSSPGTSVLKVRNEENTGWKTFVSAESTVSDFHCYVSATAPAFTEPGMLWMTIPVGGMDAADAAIYTCRAVVSAAAPSPTAARILWMDT